MEYTACGRTFCLFDNGRAGWVPCTAETGGRVAIFLGAEVPILLCPQGNADIVFGDTYVHGMMDGQAFEDPNVKIETIKLVELRGLGLGIRANSLVTAADCLPTMLNITSDF